MRPNRKVIFEPFQGSLETEVQTRKKTKNHFTQKELIQLWLTLLKALNYLKQEGQFSRNINPRYIVKTLQDGKFKLINNLICKDLTHYKMLLRDSTDRYCFLSPDKFKALGKNNIKNIKQTYKDEIFSIAMTILYAATLGST